MRPSKFRCSEIGLYLKVPKHLADPLIKIANKKKVEPQYLVLKSIKQIINRNK